MPTSSLDWLDDELRRLKDAELDRHLQTFAGAQGATIAIDGRTYVNFGANDYLALAGDPRLAEAAVTATRTEGWGAGASPLVVGHAASHARLEQAIAAFEETEAALLFSTGYAANVGAITALVGRGDVVFSDALNHASIVDGCRLSRAEIRVYPHNDVDALATMLADAATFRRRLIVTDGLFSMDGDVAPLAALADLANRHDAMLAVDEAHATGVFGRHGRGTSEACGVEERVDVRIGTLSKGLGSAGGFVAGRRTLIDWLINRARPYVFSTALPPAAAAASCAALEIVQGEPFRRSALLERAATLRDTLRSQGWDVGPSTSQIIPIIAGDAGRTLALAQALRERGFVVPPIRPPSVPDGASRLRLSLSYGHTAEAISALVEALKEVRSAECGMRNVQSPDIPHSAFRTPHSS
jgi:8-amino-7-oxononanoate synthase